MSSLAQSLVAREEFSPAAGTPRSVALSAGTVEYWVLDAEARTVHTTDLGGSRVYVCGEAVP
jgi:hypothetical protein